METVGHGRGLDDDAALTGLQRRIDLQTEQLTAHARELGRLREDLERLNARLEDHETTSASAPV